MGERMVPVHPQTLTTPLVCTLRGVTSPGNHGWDGDTDYTYRLDPFKADHDESAKTELYNELGGKVKEALATGRPLLHHLNGDTTWLMQIPIKDSSGGTSPSIRWFNILLDPWLTGAGVVGHWMVIYFTHSILPALSHVDDIGDLCVEVDRISGVTPPEPSKSRQARINLVLCTNPGPDHTNTPTLKTIDPTIPIAAARDSVKIIRSLRHFDNVYDIPVWQQSTADTMIDTSNTAKIPLPPGLEVTILGPREGEPWAQLEVALHLSWSNPKTVHNEAPRHGIIYVPHGLLPSHVTPSSSNDLKLLALIAGTQYSTMSWSYFTGYLTNHGTDAGFAAIERTGAERYIATHDEAFDYTGIIGYMVKRLAEVDFESARQNAFNGVTDDSGKSVIDVDKEERKRRIQGAVCSRPEVGQSIVLA